MKAPQLTVKPGLCTGCQMCEVACSVGWAGQLNPKRARLRLPDAHPRPEPPAFCLHCPESPCVEACPLELFKHCDETGLVVLNEEECTGCGECLESCPFGAIFEDPATGKALKCDMCAGRGDPWCARHCPRGVLEVKAEGDGGEQGAGGH